MQTFNYLGKIGGVAASFIEWEQNLENKTYKKEAVLKRLEGLMGKAFENVWSKSQKYKINLKEASYLVALKKILN